MKLNIRRVAALAFSALLVFSAVGCAEGAEIVQTELSFTKTEVLPYGEALKTDAAVTLHTTIGNAVEKTKGESIANIWKTDANAQWLLFQMGSAFERRGIPSKDYIAIVDTLCAKEELLVAFLDGSRSAGERFATVFGEIAATVGVEKTALIAYDAAVLYCRYQNKHCLDKYDAHPDWTYFLDDAELWQGRAAELQKIGETNFAGLLRFWLSGLTVFSAQSNQTATGFLSSLYAGEVALYLRTQGQVLEKLSLRANHYAFLLTFAGEVLKVEACKAIVKANKQADYAAHMAGVVQGTAKALKNAGEACAELLLDEDVDGFVNELASLLTEGEKKSFSNLFSVENAADSYAQYIKNKKLTAKFEEYCKQEKGMWEEKMYQHSPQLAFLVFRR